MITKTQTHLALLGCLVYILAGSSVLAQQTLFTEDFNTTASANGWDVFSGAGNGIEDFTVEFGFDYSQQSVTVNGVTGNIPAAPNSDDGSTSGLKVLVNANDGEASPSGVSLYPRGQFLSGNYAMKVDMWMNYNGGPYGGSGSTENANFGLNHAGDKVIRHAQAPSDGVWFTVTGEAGVGSSGDFRAYVGDGVDAPIQLDDLDGGFLDRDGDQFGEIGVAPADPISTPLKLLFPSPEFETAGAPGKRWVEVEVRQENGLVTWLIDGYVIAEHGNAIQIQGAPMIGYMDLFSSIANPGDDNFVIFDNFRIESLDGVDPLPVISMTLTDLFATEPSDAAQFQLIRSGGDSNTALDVNLKYLGTAELGVDYNAPTSVRIPAGSDRVTISVEPIDDNIGEPSEDIYVVIAKGTGYEVRNESSVSMVMDDDGDLSALEITAIRPSAYERSTSGTGAFLITLAGQASSNITVGVQVSGDAVSGTDFESLPENFVIPGGASELEIEIIPLNNTLVDGDRSVTLTLQPSDDYALGPNMEATVTLRDDDQMEGSSLFSEDFSTQVGSFWDVQWETVDGAPDYLVDFSYDYSLDGIPSAPGSGDGSTRGLYLSVNREVPTGAGVVNVYPKGLDLRRNYSLRFDMFISVGTDAGGTTEHSVFGINHDGSRVNRHGVSGGDGVWFALNGDGSENRMFARYAGSETDPLIETLPSTTFAEFFTSPPHQFANTVSGQWADVVVDQIGNQVTVTINGVTVFDFENTSEYSSGTFMLGQNDQFNSVGSLNNFVLFDNVRVVELASNAPEPTEILSVNSEGDSLTIVFTGIGGDASSYEVNSMSFLEKPLRRRTVDAEITSVGENTYQAVFTAPNVPTTFYQIVSL